MKKILAILFAVVVAISAISISIVPAAAAYADGRFEVDRVLSDYGSYQSVPTTNAGDLNLVGQYRLVVDYNNMAISLGDMIDGEIYPLFVAPLGYYVYFNSNHEGSSIGSAYSSISIAKLPYNGGASIVQWVFDLDGVVTYGQLSSYEDYEFILPSLPNVETGTVADRFLSGARSVAVERIGDVSPSPAHPIPDQSLPRILEVWQTVSRWIVDGLSSVVGVFYVAGQLTLIGTLAVISVGIALIFLLIAFIRKFLFLRG